MKAMKIFPTRIPKEEQEIYPDPENHKYACPYCGLYLRYLKKGTYQCEFCGFKFKEKNENQK